MKGETLRCPRPYIAESFLFVRRTEVSLSIERMFQQGVFNEG